jgi:YHS domain-containing protein
LERIRVVPTARTATKENSTFAGGYFERRTRMEALVYFVLWALLFFVMMRFGCGAHIMGHGHNSKRSPGNGRVRNLRWIPPDKDRDPVCGKSVVTANAKPSVYDGTVYYFCSRTCREQFEAAPDLYLSGNNSDTGHVAHDKGMETSNV